MTYAGCCDSCGFSEEQHRPDGAAAFCDAFPAPLDLDALNDWDFYIATGIDRTLIAPSASSQEAPKA